MRMVRQHLLRRLHSARGANQVHGELMAGIGRAEQKAARAVSGKVGHAVGEWAARAIRERAVGRVDREADRDLRLAARKGDRSALSLALDQMRTLALSPKYWEKYLTLLRNPLARLIDMVVIKQGERIAHQKGWKLPKTVRAPEKPRKPKKGQKARGGRARVVAGSAAQIPLFE